MLGFKGFDCTNTDCVLEMPSGRFGLYLCCCASRDCNNITKIKDLSVSNYTSYTTYIPPSQTTTHIPSSQIITGKYNYCKVEVNF